MIDLDWSRWIFIGTSDHFGTGLEALPSPLPQFIEGQQRDTKDLTNFVEFRMDGPWFTELSKDYWRIYVEVNILVQTAMKTGDFHQHHRNLGNVAALFRDIQVFRCGDGPNDDDSPLGCLKLIQDERKRERVVIANFGQIEPHVQVQQGTVEGHFEMKLGV